VGEHRYACSPGCSFNAASLVEAGGALRLKGRETSYNAASGGLLPIAYRILSVDTIRISSSRAVVSMVMPFQLRIATASMSREICQKNVYNGLTKIELRLSLRHFHQITSVAWRRHLLPKEGG
jgi:hypothetical protein